MIASRLISVFLFFVTFGLVAASPAPAALVKRAGTSRDVEAVFINLKGTTDSILPKIDALVANGQASDATITPLVNSLADAINAASSSVAAIRGPVSTSGGPSKDEIAVLIAGITGDILTTLDNVQTTEPDKPKPHIPAFPGLVIKIDFALKTLLIGVDFLLVGVIGLVSKLLVGVAGLLKGLGFILFFTILKLV